MALIICPECGQKISTHADKCPFCGLPQAMYNTVAAPTASPMQPQPQVQAQPQPQMQAQPQPQVQAQPQPQMQPQVQAQPQPQPQPQPQMQAQLQIRTDKPMWLVAAGCAVAALIFCFFPSWISVTAEGYGVSHTETVSIFDVWYGIIGFIAILLAILFMLLGQYKFAIWAGLVIAAMAFFGIIDKPDGYAEAMEIADAFDIDVNVSRWGAILSLVAGLGVSFGSYKLTKE
jgi:hypothetical protein